MWIRLARTLRIVVVDVPRPSRSVGQTTSWPSGQGTAAQQAARPPRQSSVIVALLLLILATLVAGPVGFLVMSVLLLAWALVTGTLHLVIDLLVLPFRLIGALVGGGRSR